MMNTNKLFFILFILILSGSASASEQWLTIQNSSLEPEVGSALDLSSLTQHRDSNFNKTPSISPQGEHFLLGTKPDKNIKFFTATLAISSNSGGYPDHATANRLAVMIKRNGYNAVRVHFTEAMLMTGRSKDFDFDPEQLDRFFYLMNALREQGLYFFVDMLGSWNGAYGDVKGNRWTRGQYDVTLGSLISDTDKLHWLNLAKVLWNKKNPYSNLTTLGDPALAGVMLVNEGDADYLLRSSQDKKLLPPFKNWLLKKYQTNQSVEDKTGGAFDKLSLPSVSEHSALNREFQLFTTEMQTSQLNWMKQQLSNLGFNGPVTSFNTYPSYHNAVTRSQLSFVDQHQYADHPKDGMVESGTSIGMGRLLDGRNRYLDRLAWNRLYGQPFTVSEYGQPFWNPYRWEVAPFTAAYAGFQDWSMIAHFGSAFSVSRPASGKWRTMMVPFEIGVDPTLQAGEKIAAFLFGRGDVSPAKAKLAVKVNPDLAAGYSSDRFVSWQLAQMQYVLGVGLNVNGSGKVNADVKSLQLSSDEDEIATKTIYSKLLAAKVLEDDGWTNPSLQRYQSSTKELKLDLKQNYMTVITKGSVGVMGGAGSKVESPFVSIKVDAGEGAFFACDLGAGDLSQSKRVLLVMSTDSRNSNMTFLDKEETKLDQIGSFPAKIKDASINIEVMQATNLQHWKLYALDFNGRRNMELPMKTLDSGKAQVQIHLAALANKVSPFFELVRE
ncbi:MAG TPA: hypothetical protein VGJ90_13760 [Methylophilaceae bacterium]|jgi:hypothetical protein